MSQLHWHSRLLRFPKPCHHQDRIALAAIGTQDELVLRLRPDRRVCVQLRYCSTHLPTNVAAWSILIRIQVSAALKVTIQTVDSKQPTRAAGRPLYRSAVPQLSRQCRGQTKPPRINDIACNITNQAAISDACPAGLCGERPLKPQDTPH